MSNKVIDDKKGLLSDNAIGSSLVDQDGPD